MIQAPEKTTPDIRVKPAKISGPTQKILCRAKEIIQERGWGQGKFFEAREIKRPWYKSLLRPAPRQWEYYNFCLVGAVHQAAEEYYHHEGGEDSATYIAKYYKSRVRMSGEGIIQFERTKNVLFRYLHQSPVGFNDTPGRTKEEVLAVLEELTTC